MIRPSLARFCILLALGAGCHHAHRERDSLDAQVVVGPDESEDAADASSEGTFDPDDEANASDAGNESDASSASADAGAPDEADAGTALHGSFETAQMLEVNTKLLTDEQSADQVDYYAFRGKAGSFYEITTDNGTFTPDNVMSLFDAQRKLIASNDDGGLWPGDGLDARLIVRVPEDGLYYIKIEDPLTPADFFEGEFSLLYYHLSVREVSASTPGFASATSGLTFLQDAKNNYRYVTVIDGLDAEQKSVAFAGSDGMALIAHIHAGGNTASGSSLSDGELFVTAADGHRLSFIDRAKTQNDFRPPVTAGAHQITLSSKSARGANPFFVMDLVLLPENPREKSEADNDRKEGAEAITLSKGAAGRGLLLSRLPRGDVDYYKVTAQAGHQILFNCEGESSGSGVRGLRAELRDDADSVLQSMAEGADEVRYTTERTGTYFLRLSSDTPAADASAVEPWVRCVVFAS